MGGAIMKETDEKTNESEVSFSEFDNLESFDGLLSSEDELSLSKLEEDMIDMNSDLEQFDELFHAEDLSAKKKQPMTLKEEVAASQPKKTEENPYGDMVDDLLEQLDDSGTLTFSEEENEKEKQEREQFNKLLESTQMEKSIDQDNIDLGETLETTASTVNEESALSDLGELNIESETMDSVSDLDNILSLDDMLAADDGDDILSLDNLEDFDKGAEAELRQDNNGETGTSQQDFTVDKDLLNMIPDINKKDKELDESVTEQKTEKPEKKIGLLKRLFGNIHDEKAVKLEEKEQIKEEKKKLAKQEKEKNKKSKEELKAETAEKKKEKAEKAAEKKALQDAKKAEKEEKKLKKKQELEAKKAQEEAEAEPEGRINRAGAVIVCSFFALLGIFIIFGTKAFSYSKSISNAEEYLDIKKYNNAYEEIYGIKVKEKDEALRNRIMTVMYVNKQLNSYNNYFSLEMYDKALDSLLKGLQRYDKYIEQAIELGVENDLDYIKNQILAELNHTYGVSSKKAYEMLNSKSKEEYTKKVKEVASKI